jgi:hypothetical protein
MPKPSEVTAQEIEKPDAQPTVRESITAALKEQIDGPEDKEEEDKEEEDDDLSEDPAGEGILEDDEDKKSLKKVAKAKKPLGDDDDDDEEDIKVKEDEEEETEEEGEPEVKEPKLKKTTIPAPDNWKDTADWDKIPASVRQKIIKREEEVSNGFRHYGEKARAFDEYEQFVGPRRQSMARIGVSPAQVVGRALDWMDALGHPDPKVKGEAFRVLAGNFGIDVASLAGGNSGGESFRVAGGDGSELPDQVKAYISGMESKVAALEQQLGGVVNNFQSQQDRAAGEYLTQWAEKRPHFAKVQPLMVKLLNSGAVPLKNGTLDLDTAYDMAVNANPEVRELVRLETARAAKDMADKKAKKLGKDKQVALTKARAANGSLKPGSPTAATLRKNATGLSVRDTIKLSRLQLEQASE